MEIAIDEVDGVRVVWADLPGEPQAGLLLRMGMADETLTQRGTAHLLEHLALHGLGRPGDHTNGCTDALVTSFVLRGDPAGIADGLAALTAQLVVPPVGRMPDEIRLLRAESDQRAQHFSDSLWTWRYGARGYGAVPQPEYGLFGMTPERLRAWAARFAVAGNALVWMTCPPPSGMRLNLPAAQGVPAPPLDLGMLPALPAWYPGVPDAVCLSAVLPYSPSVPALGHVVRARLVDELRVRRAVSYSPAAAVVLSTRDDACLVLSADLVPGADRVPATGNGATTYLLGALTALAGGSADRPPVTTAEISAYVTQVRHQEDDPGLASAHLAWLARRILLGSPAEQLLDLEAMLAQVTPESVASAASAAARSVLACVPTGFTPPAPYRKVPRALVPPVEGDHVRPISASGDHFVISERGLTLGHPGTGVTVETSRTEAVLARDDQRVLIGSDATHIAVDPAGLEQGQDLIARIDHQWPAGLRIDLAPPEPPPLRETGIDMTTTEPAPEESFAVDESDSDETADSGELVTRRILTLPASLTRPAGQARDDQPVAPGGRTTDGPIGRIPAGTFTAPARRSWRRPARPQG